MLMGQGKVEAVKLHEAMGEVVKAMSIAAASGTQVTAKEGSKRKSRSSRGCIENGCLW
jgi:hypothetical protein